MGTSKEIQQPLLGILGTIIVVVMALTICSQFPPATLLSWVAVFVMCSIPAQIVLIAVWQGKYPGFMAELGQPAKGIAILAMMGVAAAVVMPGVLLVSGGSLAAPSPFVSMFTVLTVCVSFWVMPLFQCWPVSAVTGHPVGIGIGCLLVTYIGAYVVWVFGFDFAAMKGAPFYLATLDPHGAFGAWPALSFIVTCSLVIIGLVMFDFWPVTMAAEAVPALGRQPFRTLFAAALVLILSAAIYFGFVNGLHMDVVDYQVRVPVSGLFGQLILLHMMQTAPFQTMAQPFKGIALTVLVVILAPLTYWLYSVAALALVGPMPAGAPGYVLDVWIATAMLSVTFPLFVTYGDAFGFWPLKR